MGDSMCDNNDADPVVMELTIYDGGHSLKK